MNILKKDYIIGLDIGSTSVKIAQFLRREDGIHLVKADIEEIGCKSDKLPTSSEKEILPALKKLLREVDIKRSKFIVSINCPKTCIRRVTAPYMPKGELREGIRLEAKNYFPFSISDALLDFEILGEVVEKGVKKYQLLVATSPKETVDKYISLLSSVGIRPSSFIPAPLALQRLVEHTPPMKGEANAILDLKGRYTELAIFAGKDFVFSRKIPIAGCDFTTAMTGVLVSDRGQTGLSLDEAEKIKREIGIPAKGGSGLVDDKISTTQILSMIRPPLEQLVNEIERCFDYYREETGGGKIDSLVLFGGGASMKGLPEFLSEGLEIEVKLGNPLGGLKIEPHILTLKGKNQGEEISHRLILAIGAGLTGTKAINLLPPEIKGETKKTFKRTTFEVIAVTVILSLAFIYIGMRIRLTNFQKRRAAAGMELLSLQPQLRQVEMQNLANKILIDEPYWEDVFKELSNIIPGNIYFTEFDMKGKTIKMRGIVASGEPEKSLSDFILALEKGIFKNVKLVSTKELKEKSGNEFELECRVD